MQIIKRFILFPVFSFACIVYLQATTIGVFSQHDFDNLSRRIQHAISADEKDIIVDIKAKVLTFSEKQILFSGIKQKDVSIAIHGNGVQIFGNGHYVTKLTSPDYMYLKDGKYHNPWTEFVQATDTLEIVDKNLYLCRTYSPHRNKVNRNPKGVFIQHTCWYLSHISPVTVIDRQTIEFDGRDWALPMGKAANNLNLDYHYAKVFPRYRLFGTKKVPKRLFECTESTLLQIQFCYFKIFSIDGINVIGSNSLNPLIFLNTNQIDNITIRNSSFSCIGGTLLLDRNTNNITFCNNYIYDIRNTGVHVEYGCTGIKIENNIFSRTGLDMMNTFAIQMNGDYFAINSNKFIDFNYGGICAGIWGGSSTDEKCRGMIADNELFYTKHFSKNIKQNTLMDSGAIYVCSRTDGITIHGNYIHNISGMKDNRGIFCDDGTRNVTITRNTIEKISNSFDIDLRWCDTYKDKVKDYNQNNRLENNNTSGKVRFETVKP